MISVRKLAIIITLLFISAYLSSCSNDVTSPVNADTIEIQVVSGNFQSGNNGEQLNNPVVVRVVDRDQVPLEDISVRFEIISGGGELDQTITNTDTEGFAEVSWTIGHDFDKIMKASVPDIDYSGEAVYVYANTDITIETSWISDIGFPMLFGENIGHDNRILESNHFLTFSDGSSDDAKIRFAKMAEETFAEVLEVFSFQNGEELGIFNSDNTTKVKIFSNNYTYFPYGAFAYNTGYVNIALDSQTFLNSPYYTLEAFRLDVKHETVHLIQFLLGLDELPNLWPDVWFSEGLAVYISNNRPPLASNQELNEWQQTPGNFNPILVKEPDEYPSQGRRWYDMFGLAVKYLLHEEGHGKTFPDVIEMYRYMASSHDGFADAFERYMGISLQYYEDNFFDLMSDFLNRSEIETYE